MSAILTEPLPGPATRSRDDANPYPRFMTVKQVAHYLSLNEKKVYALVSEGKIPGTKITGKWMFPRDLVDQWMLETSHGGMLADRLLVAGGDDPLLYRAVAHLAEQLKASALVSYSSTGTQLGLDLLARHRADMCGIHWGPAAESEMRHPGLLKHHPQHREWVLVRLFLREQGLILSPRLRVEKSLHLGSVITDPRLRWACRQQGAGSQRFLQEVLAEHGSDSSSLPVFCTARSEREAAACIAMGQADAAPGVRSVAVEFGLDFLPLGWEAFDLVLGRRVYFRTLFQRLMAYLQEPVCHNLARQLGGYDFSDQGRLIWSEETA